MGSPSVLGVGRTHGTAPKVEVPAVVSDQARPTEAMDVVEAVAEADVDKEKGDKNVSFPRSGGHRT
jgi:hypothetical protein